MSYNKGAVPFQRLSIGTGTLLIASAFIPLHKKLANSYEVNLRRPTGHTPARIINLTAAPILAISHMLNKKYSDSLRGYPAAGIHDVILLFGLGITLRRIVPVFTR